MPYPTPLHGQSGSPRNPTEAINSLIRPRIRIFSGISALELWFAVPDPHTWADRKPAEAHGGSRKLKIPQPPPPSNRIFPGNSALELWVAAPDPLNGQTGSPRKLTEAKIGQPLPRNRKFYGNSALELWVTVPDPLKWTDRKPKGSHGSTRKPRIGQSPLAAEYPPVIQR